MSFAFCVTLALAFAAAHPASAGQASTVTIDHRIHTAIQGFPGTVSLFAKNLGDRKKLRASRR